MSLIGKIWGVTKGLGKEVVGEVAALTFVRKFLRHAGEEVGEVMGKKVGNQVALSLETCRSKLLGYYHTELKRYDARSAKNLRRRQRERQFLQKGFRHGDENKMVAILSKLWMDYNDDPILRNEVFAALGRMSDRQFNAELETVNDDVVHQWVERAKENVRQVVQVIDQAAEDARPTVQGWTARLRARNGR